MMKKMDFWRKTSWLTKTILGVLGLLLLILLALVLASRGVIPGAQQMVQKLLAPQSTPTPGIQILPSPTPQLFPPGTPLIIAIGMTQVYSGPGEDQDKVAILEPGRKARIIGMNEEESWWAVEMPYLQGGRGWVMAERVQAENTLAVKVVSAEGSPVQEAQVFSGKALTNINVRSGPGLNYQKVGVVEMEQEVQLLGVDPQGFWYQIQAADGPDGKGWIAVDYIQTSDSDELPVVGFQPANANKDIPTPPSGEPSLTALAVINIRAGPDTNFEILGKLQQGQSAEILGISPDGRWYAIRYTPASSGRAWVSADFVETNNADNVQVLK